MHGQSLSETQYVVLPPSKAVVPGVFQNVIVSKHWHADLIRDMQRLRGRVYAIDGAVQPEDLTSDGRHKMRTDDQSWHVLALNHYGKVCACLRYLEEHYARSFDDLHVRHAALTRSPMLGSKFRRAVEFEMEYARQMGTGFGEVGGWAVAEDHRGTLEPLRIILTTYGLLELLGGCSGVATATRRHHSSSMLRRIGLSSLQADGMEFPAYYDPQYRCEMEVLRFDSRHPNPKYRGWVHELAAHLSDAPVVCGVTPRGRKSVFGGFEIPAEPALVPVA